MMAIKNTDTERRKRLRIPFNTSVVVQTASKKKIEGELNDISINGIYIKSDTVLKSGESCEVKILITGKSNELRLKAEGWVARKGENGIGIQFKDDLEWWTIFSIYSTYGKSEDNKDLQKKNSGRNKNKARKSPLRLVSSDGVWYKQMLPVMMDSQKKKNKIPVPNYALGYI